MFSHSLLSFYSGAGNLNSSHLTEQRSRLSSQPGTVRLDAFTHCLLAKCAPEVRKWTPRNCRKYVHLPKAKRSSFAFRKSYNCDEVKVFLSFANSWFAQFSKSLWKVLESSSILVESYLKLFENTFEGVVIFAVGNARVLFVFLEWYCIYLESIVFVWKRPCLFSYWNSVWTVPTCGTWKNACWLYISFKYCFSLPLWLYAFLFTDTGSSSADTQNCNRKFSWSLQMWRNNFSSALHQISSQSFCCAVISNGSSKRQTQSVNISLYNLFFLFRIFVLIQVL